jgi:Spy/CpxP family protein refolding chaperone
MRFLSKCLLAAALFVAVAGGLQAQRPGGGQQRAPQPLGVLVLTNADLQKELKITDDQKKEFKDLMTKAEELNKKRTEAMSGGGRPDQAKVSELQKEAETLAADVKKAGEKGFTDDQKKRMKQIDVQRMGLGAFGNEDVMKELKLTDDQKKTLKETADATTKAMRDIRSEVTGGGQGRPTPEQQAEIAKKTETLTTETMEKVMKLMTDDQKKAYKEMTGEKFDVAKLQARTPRRDN